MRFHGNRITLEPFLCESFSAVAGVSEDRKRKE